MIYKLDYILNHLSNCIENKSPFSIVRIGDGDLKIIRLALKKNYHEEKFRQQGLPKNDKIFNKILTIYKEACQGADYISNFDVYFLKEYLWKRSVCEKTLRQMINWKDIYTKIGITNEDYCSPEIGFYFFLSQRKNLFSLMKNLNVCLVNCFPNVDASLNKMGYNTTMFQIPGRNQNHYSKYKNNLKILRQMARKYDLFLIGGGMLGRGYSNIIKRNGGICVDIGQVFDVWHNKKVPPRLKGLVKYNQENMMFSLTEKGKLYEGAI